MPDRLADEETMIPVDRRGVDGEFNDVEELVEKKGHEGTAEAFVKAREYFLANKDGERRSSGVEGNLRFLAEDGR